MVRRLNRLIGILIIVGVALYVVVLNRESVVVHLGRESSVTANFGVVLIVTFAIGFFLATLIAAFYGVKGYLRERRLKNREKDRLAFYEGILSARSALASGEFDRACAMWEKIISKDPTNIIARVELSRGLEERGDIRDALRVIDEARAAAPNNIEVLFRAAELNISLNNKTAALDNLALVLYNQPNRHAATLARDLSEELGRVEDALEYQRQLEATTELSDDERRKILARLELKQAVKDSPSSPREGIDSVLKRYPDFPPALELLAQEEVKQGNSDSAAQLLARAARSTGSPEFWHKLTRLWLAEKNPQKALAAAKAALKDARGISRLIAELETARLMIAIDMIDEAMASLNGFDALAKSQRVEPTEQLLRQWAILTSLCHMKRGDNRAASEVLLKMCDDELELATVPDKSVKARSGEAAPAPRLSTP